MMNPLLTLIGRISLASMLIVMSLERLLIGLNLFHSPNLTFSRNTLIGSALELIIGVCIATGSKVQILSFIVAGVLTVDAVAAHHFWTYSGPDFHQQLLHFMKNLSIVGGFLLLASKQNPQ